VAVDGVVLDEVKRARLAGARFGRVVELAETTSTNKVAVEEAGRGAPEGLVVVADYQSAGRGRFDRRWEAPKGKSLLFSVLARPEPGELPPGGHHLAVGALSLALAEAVTEVAGVELALKWPNDLVERRPPERKVAGLLAEMGAGDAMVIGAGLNVAWAPEGATCLEELAARPLERGEILVEALLAFGRLYGQWDEVRDLYRERCSTLGREVTVTFSGGPPQVTGTAVDVDESGRLLLETAGPGGPATVVTIVAGDVAHASVGPRVF